MNEKEPKVFSITDVDWEEVEQPAGAKFFDKRWITDETGMIVNVTHYPKGYWKSCHRHNLSHGLFVISGKLKTDHGVYGPGSFIWHPEGYVGGHGATEDEDCLFLFVGNKPFHIEFVDEEKK